MRHETRDAVSLTSLPPCMFILCSVMLLVVQDRKDKDMAQSTSPILNSDATHLLRLTRITSQQERQSTRQASAPFADIRNIRITQSCSQWHIGRGHKEYEPASNNAYFASEAVEHNHVLVTPNDKGELCIQDNSVLGSVLISGEKLPKRTLTPLPPSSEIVLMRSWNLVTSIWKHKLALKATICLASSALSSMENSSTSCVQQQSPLNDCAVTDFECSSNIAPTHGRKSHFSGVQKEPSVSQGARKRLHNQTESDDDNFLPSRPDKSPRLALPDIQRWQENVHVGPWPNTCSTHSQQDHGTCSSQTSLPDRSPTRSRSNSSSNQPPAIEPEKSPYPIILPATAGIHAIGAICRFVDSLSKGPSRPEHRAIYQHIMAIAKLDSILSDERL